MAATVRTSQRVTGGRPGEEAAAGDDTRRVSGTLRRAGWGEGMDEDRRAATGGFVAISPLPTDAAAVTMSPSRWLPVRDAPLTPRGVSPDALLPPPPRRRRFVALLGAAARGDDTEEFLKPDNWEGRADLFKLDPKATTIVGETMEDPKYNTFFCTKKKYCDFELSFKVQLRDAVGNSGVQIRSTLRDDKKFVVAGPQVDVGKGYWGSLYGEGVGGMMKASSPDAIKKAVKETSSTSTTSSRRERRSRSRSTARRWSIRTSRRCPGKDKDGRSPAPGADGRDHRLPGPRGLPEDARRVQGHQVHGPGEEVRSFQIAD